MSQNKDYLGYGVYADFDGHGITLTAENGLWVTAGPIYLKPAVLVALGRYCGRMGIFDSKPPRAAKPVTGPGPVTGARSQPAEAQPHVYHLNDKGTNACKDCGLDLAHPIHTRGNHGQETD